MTFFYDFGLICLILYFVTQNQKEIKLPWFEINLKWLIKNPKKAKKPKKHILGIMILCFGAVLFIYLRFNTLFFLSVGRGKTTSLFNPITSRWLSYSVISIFSLEILHYISRLFTKSSWIKFTKDGTILIILWLIINNPIKDGLVDFPPIEFLSTIFTFLLLFLTIIASINCLQSLADIINSRKKTQE